MWFQPSWAQLFHERSGARERVAHSVPFKLAVHTIGRQIARCFIFRSLLSVHTHRTCKCASPLNDQPSPTQAQRARRMLITSRAIPTGRALSRPAASQRRVHLTRRASPCGVRAFLESEEGPPKKDVAAAPNSVAVTFTLTRKASCGRAAGGGWGGGSRRR